MYTAWEKLTPRERLRLAILYLASITLAWLLGFGWGRHAVSVPQDNQTAASTTEVVDLTQPSPAPEAVQTTPTEPTTPPPAEEVVVHVSGAVKQAGVYRLAAGSRVADAIEQAGGATANADLESLNLAEPLTDGQKVHVPRKGETPPLAAAATMAPPTPRTMQTSPRATARASVQFPIDLNRATAEQLEAIPGVGPVLAQRIIEYRQANGRFNSVDELLEVRGIGPKRLEQLRAYVVVR